MSWAGIASNQTVTFNNLQDAVTTGVFTQKTSIPATNECITKTDANTYVNINTSNSGYSSKSSNQLVVKSDLTAPPSGVVFSISSGLYPLSGMSSTSATGTLTNYTSGDIDLHIVFNSAGLNSGSVSGDNMVSIPLTAVTLSGTISSYGQLIYAVAPSGYRMASGSSINISITKNDGLGGGSTLSIYWAPFNQGGAGTPVTY